RSEKLAALDLPQLDEHIVAGRDEQLILRRHGQVAHPASMRFYAPFRLAVAPPDQITVEAAGDDERFHSNDCGYVIIVLGPRRHGFLLVSRQIEDVDAIVIAAGAQARRVEGERLESAFVLVSLEALRFRRIDWHE